MGEGTPPQRSGKTLCIYLLKVILFGQLICITFTLSGLCRYLPLTVARNWISTVWGRPSLTRP